MKLVPSKMINLNLNNENCVLRRKKVFIEIPVLLIYFAITFADSITASFITYRTCYVIVGYKEWDCTALSEMSVNKSTALLDRKVQPSAIVVISTISIIQGLIPPLLCFFIGPWSNQYGRKPIMLYSTFALIVQYATMVFISAVPHMSPWYILLSQILVCFSGGIPAFVAVIFTYLTDTIAENERGIRIAFLEAVRSCGILIGAATGLAALKSSSYVVVYTISLIILLLGWLFIWFLVPESMQVSETQQNKLHKFFDFVSLVNTAKIAFKSREGYGRTLLLAIMSLVVFYTIAASGSTSVSSLYFQHRFHWNSTNTSNYNIVINVTTIIGGIICVYVLHEKLKCQEFIGVIAGLVSLISGCFVLSVAATTSLIHLGACIQCFGPAVLSMAKSFLSKLVPHEEASTVFAVVGSLETVFTLVGVSLFAVIYHGTVLANPATFILVAAGLYLFQLVLISTLLFIQKYWSPMTFSRIHDEDY